MGDYFLIPYLRIRLTTNILRPKRARKMEITLDRNSWALFGRKLLNNAGLERFWAALWSIRRS
jgi:hypothetical protein